MSELNKQSEKINSIFFAKMGVRLKEVRLRKRLTVADAAKLLSVTVRTVMNYESTGATDINVLLNYSNTFDLGWFTSIDKYLPIDYLDELDDENTRYRLRIGVMQFDVPHVVGSVEKKNGVVTGYSTTAINLSKTYWQVKKLKKAKDILAELVELGHDHIIVEKFKVKPNEKA